MNKRPPMTAQEARDNLAAMMRVTKKPARMRLLEVALSPLGNLSDEARAVYGAALDADRDCA
jgi:hypothetical protein